MKLHRVVNNFAIKVRNSFQNVDFPYLNHPELQRLFPPELVVNDRVTSRFQGSIALESINPLTSVLHHEFLKNLQRPSQLKPVN